MSISDALGAAETEKRMRYLAFKDSEIDGLQCAVSALKSL
jgi:hypothetical protein